MSYLRIFAPWIIYAAVPASYWQFGVAAALAFSVLPLISGIRHRTPVDALLIPIATTTFIAGWTVFAVLNPDSPLQPYGGAIAQGVLAATSGISLLLHKPFTLGIAKLSSPKELWDNPLFVRTAYVLTSVWTASFALSCVLLFAVAHTSPIIQIATQFAGFAIPVIFTGVYVKRVRARGQAAAAAKSQLTVQETA